MIAKITHKEPPRVSPFLIRFAQKCSPKSMTDKKWKALNTIITEVGRETTDDR